MLILNRIKPLVVGAAAVAVLALSPTVAAADNGNSNSGNSVTICHATGSQTNPYEEISPNANGVISGHVNHQDTKDIIPPFDYNDQGTTKHFAGQNYDVNGQAILKNHCVATTGTVLPGGQVLGSSSTSGGQGSGSQSQAASGGVNAGAGGAATINSAAVAGLGVSLLSLLSGAAWIVLKKQ